MEQPAGRVTRANQHSSTLCGQATDAGMLIFSPSSPSSLQLCCCCTIIATLLFKQQLLMVNSLRASGISVIDRHRTELFWRHHRSSSKNLNRFITSSSDSGCISYRLGGQKSRSSKVITTTSTITYSKFAFALLADTSNEEKGKDDNEINLEFLKTELQKYLELRETMKADEVSKAKAGKIVGGSKGNVFLEYISAIPTTPIELEESYPFDYDELTKYGFSHCVKPIMQLPGGRRDAYILMNMVPPRVSSRLTPKKPREIKLDFEGTEDASRYQGMRKMSDDDIARQLQLMQKKKRNESEESSENSVSSMSSSTLSHSSNYEIPFSNRKQTSNTARRRPEWTPEMLDEEGRRRGKTYDWARKVREEEKQNMGKKDSSETIDVSGGLRVYAIIFTVLSSFAYGKATPQAIEWINASPTLITLLQIIAFILVCTSFVSSVYSSTILAPQKKRNSFIWAVKAFAGGPPAVLQLKELKDLSTYE